MELVFKVLGLGGGASDRGKMRSILGALEPSGGYAPEKCFLKKTI